jgi:Phosphotransferase enzyme family
VKIYQAQHDVPAAAPVRNGNRWRVAAVDADRNRIAARRLSDGARAIFDGDYVRAHITHGYAVTVHAAQAVIADTSHAVLGENTSRAALTAELDRRRDVASAAGNNELVKHFGSMHDDVPPPTGVPTLVHGDLKPAKMLWRDGELVSLLDWEMSFNGDPAWDLGYMLIFLPGDLHPQIPGNCDLCACGAAINSSRHGRKGPDVLSPTVCGSRRPPMRKSHR